MTRLLLIILGACVTLIGSALLGLAFTISAVDRASVRTLLSEDRIGPEILAQFRYTPWRVPEDGIRPFVSTRRSFEDCKILRYRCGTWSDWLVRRTYYEAEYQRSAGTRVVGPAVGPRPYVSPNFITHVPLITAGVVLLVVGVLRRRRRA